MNMRTAARILVAILFATSLGCATIESTGHKYIMRGSVLDVSDGTAYLCIGTEQGAKVGQEFTVYRYVKIMMPRKGVQWQYRIDTVGKVKITDTESHMAHASIVSGDVKANDVVELNP